MGIYFDELRIKSRELAGVKQLGILRGAYISSCNFFIKHQYSLQRFTKAAVYILFF